MDKSKIFGLVEKALERLYKYQNYMIQNKVHERSIVFWFGIYMYELLNKSSFSEYRIDLDYNRNHADPKKTKKFPKGIYPDIIIHRHGENNHNLTVIEFKTWWNPKNSKDIEKLKEFTDSNGDYKYQFGMSIILRKDEPEIHIIQNGTITEAIR
ncbi:MAG: hypothetical protein OEZ36_05900 [Spirochaetota bacterium]|nr:hypothetical protein [Spirochaetota bacterium]